MRVQNGVSKSVLRIFVKNSSTFWFCPRRCDLHRTSVVSATAIALGTCFSCLPAGAGYFRLVAIAMAVASDMLGGDRATCVLHHGTPSLPRANAALCVIRFGSSPSRAMPVSCGGRLCSRRMLKRKDLWPVPFEIVLIQAARNDPPQARTASPTPSRPRYQLALLIGENICPVSRDFELLLSASRSGS